MTTNAQWNRAAKARRERWKAAGLCGICGAERDAEFAMCARCRRTAREAVRRNGPAQRERRWKAVLAAYGGACACCGEAAEEFLTVDHVDGREPGDRRRGGDLYAWLIANDFPDGFRLLCWNCNCGRERNGGICPHEAERADVVPLKEVSDATG